MAKNVTLLLITAIVLTLLASGQCLHVTSCSKDPSTDVIIIKSLNAVPTPIKIPGELSLSISAEVNQPITGELRVDVTLSRNVGGMWIDVPCMSTPHGDLGSCTYRDFCHLLKNINGTCPKILVDNGIPCSCPIAPATYTIPQVTIPLDIKNFGLRTVIGGEYQASIRVTDTSTLTEIVCFDVEAEISEPSTRNLVRSIGQFFVNLFGR
uniref:MD-2-related lipid-recognition domain-containing protein n=1 Tax=Biomphalaria glabrata TaxID=6526 RepID=A0A2C9KNP7_BIOGL